ncbi:Bax inhibitor-1 family protein [Ligilactobacillus sp. LYQ135]
MSNKLVKINYKQKLEDEATQFVTKVHKLVCLEVLMVMLFCLFIYGFNLENLMSLGVLSISILIHAITHIILIHMDDIIKDISAQNTIATIIYFLNVILNGIYIIGILQIFAKTGLDLGNITLSAAIITMGVYLYAILYEKKNRDKPTNRKIIEMVSWGSCLALLLQLLIKNGIVMLIVDIITVILMSLSIIFDVKRLGEEYKDLMRMDNKTNAYVLAIGQTDFIVMDLILNFVSIIKLWVDSQD